MSKILRSLQFPGLDEVYIIPNKQEILKDEPQILNGVEDPTMVTESTNAALYAKLQAAPNGSIYIMHK